MEQARCNSKTMNCGKQLSQNLLMKDCFVIFQFTRLLRFFFNLQTVDGIDMEWGAEHVEREGDGGCIGMAEERDADGG